MRMLGAAAGVWPSYNGYLIAYPLLTAGPHKGLYNYYLSSLSLPLSPLFSSTLCLHFFFPHSFVFSVFLPFYFLSILWSPPHALPVSFFYVSQYLCRFSLCFLLLIVYSFPGSFPFRIGFPHLLFIFYFIYYLLHESRVAQLVALCRMVS